MVNGKVRVDKLSRPWFDRALLSLAEGLTTNGLT